ncbi:hypothetical protein EJ04DRAFT_571790 [Polyplosphaeria fusca]|uniref:Uncharacterized protein n=1 Tax=Polyplosphaeria fusca TaxID=682080 RepID=A0A9P4RCP9_9PLEO|nr:hypothetical protein EJ04DRAFT_571790 [Polyplosphaeria fusca]
MDDNNSSRIIAGRRDPHRLTFRFPGPVVIQAHIMPPEQGDYRNPAPDPGSQQQPLAATSMAERASNPRAKRVSNPRSLRFGRPPVRPNLRTNFSNLPSYATTPGSSARPGYSPDFTWRANFGGATSLLSNALPNPYSPPGFSNDGSQAQMAGIDRHDVNGVSSNHEGSIASPEHSSEDAGTRPNPPTQLRRAHRPTPLNMADIRAVNYSVENAFVQTPGRPQIARDQQSPSEPILSANLANFDPDRVATWRNGATTLDQSLLHSPDTPRPFTDAEMGMPYSQQRIKRTTTTISEESQSSFTTAYCVPANASRDGLGSIDGPVYASLAEMHRAQEQVRRGRDLPPLQVPGGMTIDRGPPARGNRGAAPRLEDGPRPNLQAGPSETIAREPTKTDTPSLRRIREVPDIREKSSRQEHHDKLQAAAIKAATDDPQTYTSEGLAAVMAKIFGPDRVPDDVMETLPTPAWPLPDAPSSAANEQATTVSLTAKDTGYVTGYITTLLERMNPDGARFGILVNECTRLQALKTVAENRVKAAEKEVATIRGELLDLIEDNELEKAGLQMDINHWFALWQGAIEREEGLEAFVKFAASMAAEDKREQVLAAARAAGLKIEGLEERDDDQGLNGGTV